MNKVQTFSFSTHNNGQVRVTTRLLPDNWDKDSRSRADYVARIAKAHGFANSEDVNSPPGKRCLRSTVYALAMKVVPDLELEILDEMNIIAEAKKLSMHQAFVALAEAYDQSDDVRAGVLRSAYLLCGTGRYTLAQALKQAPVFSPSVCRVLILTEGDATQNRAGGRLAADRMARKCNAFWAVLGGVIKILIGLGGHSK